MSEEVGKHLLADKVEVTVSFWPHTWPQVTAVGILSGAFVAAFYIFFVLANDGARASVLQTVTAFTGQPSGPSDSSQGFYFMGFWTPDEHTHEDLIAKYGGGEVVPTHYQWQLKSHTTNKVLQFGKELSAKFGDRIMGFRHYEITGLGKSGDVKRGKWWSATVRKEVKPEEIIDFYKAFWRPQSQFYMEAVGSPLYLKP